MRHVNSVDFQTHLGEYLELAAEGPVAVNKRGRPVAVLVSAAEYDRLRGLDEVFRAAQEAEAAGMRLGHDEIMAMILRGFWAPK